MRRILRCAVLACSLTACSDATGVRSPAPPSLSEAGSPGPSAAAAFGPETFTRQKGAPATEVRTFSAGSLSGPFRLRVENGAPDGSGRVSSAVVQLNGRTLFRPSDFDPRVAALEVEIELEAVNSLSVRLAGAPGSFLTVRVEGSGEAGPLTFCPGATPAFQDLQAALDAAEDGGTVLVCDGVHDVQGVSITRSVQLLPAGGAPVLRTAGGAVLTLQGAPDVRIGGLGFLGGDVGIRASGTVGLVVEGSSFRDHAWAGIRLEGTSGSDIRGNDFSGAIGTAIDVEGAEGLWIRQSTIRGARDNGIRASDAAGEIGFNELTACGRHCIAVESGAGDLVVAANRITLDKADANFISIVAHRFAGSGRLSIEGNRIDGGTALADPSDPASYTVTATGIQVEGWSWELNDLPFDTEPGATVFVTDNYVRNANVGIAAGYGGVIVGNDNVVELTRTAVQTWQRGRLSLRANDFVGYQAALGQGNADEPDAWISADCNWWGTAAGPQGVWGVGGDSYTPWATGPVAHVTGNPCDGGV